MALNINEHPLMDKPISVLKGISFDSTCKHKGLLDDYEDLDLYKKHQSPEPKLFSVNVQRRYDHGFDSQKS